MAYDARMDSISARISELRLDPLRFEARMEATTRFQRAYPGASIDFASEVLRLLDSKVHRMQIELQAHKGEPIVIAYPRDWWEALKARFAPVWLLAHVIGPVRYTTHTIYPWAILPDLKVPRGQRVLRWAEYESPIGRAWYTEDDRAR